VLLHAVQIGPAQADWRRTGPSGVVKHEPPACAGLRGRDAPLGCGLVDLEVVRSVAEILPVRRQQRGAAQRPSERLADGQGSTRSEPAPAKASAPRREIVGTARAGLTRSPASGGSGFVWAVSVRSSFTRPRLRSDLTTVLLLRPTWTTKPATKTQAP
jgi:hypothetical protein